MVSYGQIGVALINPTAVSFIQQNMMFEYIYLLRGTNSRIFSLINNIMKARQKSSYVFLVSEITSSLPTLYAYQTNPVYRRLSNRTLCLIIVILFAAVLHYIIGEVF